MAARDAAYDTWLVLVSLPAGLLFLEPGGRPGPRCCGGGGGESARKQRGGRGLLEGVRGDLFGPPRGGVRAAGGERGEGGAASG